MSVALYKKADESNVALVQGSPPAGDGVTEVHAIATLSGQNSDKNVQATGIALDSESQATLPMPCCVQERVPTFAFWPRVRSSSSRT